MKKNRILPVVLLTVGLLVVVYSSFWGGSPSLALKIQPANFIMPAAYKVYANPEALGGRYYLFKAILENEGTATMKNVKVEYRIPKYIDDWTEAPAPSYVLPGQSVAVMGYPSFDQSITQKNTQSKEKAEIRITYGEKGSLEEYTESFPFTMMAVNDFAFTDIPASEISSFSDMMGNYQLAACFVTAEDPAIQYYTSRIQQRILQGETAGVTRTLEESVRFMMGIYEATLRSDMVYSSTQNIPANTGDVSTLIQRIRLPRDVVTGNTGLCLELTILYASIMRNAGMEAIMFFVPGHAYPGFRLNGQYYAIESTAIGGTGMGGSAGAQQALEAGMKQLQEFFQAAQMGDERYFIVDVNDCYREGIVPMELREDAFARQKIDEYANLWQRGGQLNPNAGGNVAYAANGTANTGGGNSNDQGGGNSSASDNNSNSQSTYSRGVQFAYPAGWQIMDRPVAQIPILVSVVAASGQQNVNIQVYDIEGATSLDEGLEYLRQVLSSTGSNINYQQRGTHNGYVLLNGVTQSQNGQLQWTGAFRLRNNRVEGITMANNTPGIQQIIASLR